jgi:ribosome-binding protein aMBF1 (putative translation factor)
MGSKFSDYVIDVETRADDLERAALDAFAEHYADERRLLFDVTRQLVAAREAQHLTQKQLADLAGIGQSEISRIERGQTNPTLETVAKLTRPLGVHLALVDREGHPVPAP